MSQVDVVIAAGGTAGHMLPAIALADELSKRGVAESAISFVGSGRGLEDSIFAGSGYRVIKFKGRGMPRRSPCGILRSIWSNLIATIERSRRGTVQLPIRDGITLEAILKTTQPSRTQIIPFMNSDSGEECPKMLVV